MNGEIVYLDGTENENPRRVSRAPPGEVEEVDLLSSDDEKDADVDDMAELLGKEVKKAHLFLNSTT